MGDASFSIKIDKELFLLKNATTSEHLTELNAMGTLSRSDYAHCNQRFARTVLKRILDVVNIDQRGICHSAILAEKSDIIQSPFSVNLRIETILSFYDPTEGIWMENNMMECVNADKRVVWIFLWDKRNATALSLGVVEYASIPSDSIRDLHGTKVVICTKNALVDDSLKLCLQSVSEWKRGKRSLGRLLAISEDSMHSNSDSMSSLFDSNDSMNVDSGGRYREGYEEVMDESTMDFTSMDFKKMKLQHDSPVVKRPNIAPNYAKFKRRLEPIDLTSFRSGLCFSSLGESVSNQEQLFDWSYIAYYCSMITQATKLLVSLSNQDKVSKLYSQHSPFSVRTISGQQLLEVVRFFDDWRGILEDRGSNNKEYCKALYSFAMLVCPCADESLLIDGNHKQTVGESAFLHSWCCIESFIDYASWIILPLVEKVHPIDTFSIYPLMEVFASKSDSTSIFSGSIIKEAQQLESIAHEWIEQFVLPVCEEEGEVSSITSNIGRVYLSESPHNVLSEVLKKLLKYDCSKFSCVPIECSIGRKSIMARLFPVNDGNLTVPTSLVCQEITCCYYYKYWELMLGRMFDTMTVWFSDVLKDVGSEIAVLDIKPDTEKENALYIALSVRRWMMDKGSRIRSELCKEFEPLLNKWKTKTHPKDDFIIHAFPLPRDQRSREEAYLTLKYHENGNIAPADREGNAQQPNAQNRRAADGKYVPITDLEDLFKHFGSKMSFETMLDSAPMCVKSLLKKFEEGYHLKNNDRFLLCTSLRSIGIPHDVIKTYARTVREETDRKDYKGNRIPKEDEEEYIAPYLQLLDRCKIKEKDEGKHTRDTSDTNKRILMLTPYNCDKITSQLNGNANTLHKCPYANSRSNLISIAHTVSELAHWRPKILLRLLDSNPTGEDARMDTDYTERLSNAFHDANSSSSNLKPYANYCNITQNVIIHHRSRRPKEVSFSWMNPASVWSKTLYKIN